MDTAAAPSAPITRLAEDLAGIYDNGARGRDFIRAAEPALKRLLGAGSFLPPEAMEPSDNSYARHLLYCDLEERFVVVAMVWKPGQGTPIHDHDGAWGMLGMVEGGLEVVNYFAVGEVAEGEVELRNDAPHTPSAGEQNSVCGCADIHTVRNRRDDVAVSIHVYPRDLEACHFFEPIDDEKNRFYARRVSISYTGDSS